MPPEIFRDSAAATAAPAHPVDVLLTVRRITGVGAVLTVALAVVAVLTPASSGSAADTPRGRCEAGRVSLTFDDGPSSTQTARLVRILKEAQVPATFFMVGQRVAAAPRTARRVSRSGFLVANHSYAHADMTGQSSAAIRRTIRATDAVLRRAGARPTNLMRPPYGAMNTRVRDAIRSTGLRPVLWDVDPRDWESVSAGTIAARVLSGLRAGRSNVVLQHDGIRNSPNSVLAVPRIVRGARRRGFCFVALDERGRPGFPTPRADLSLVPTHRVAEGERVRAVVRLSKPAGRDTSVRIIAGTGTARIGADVAAFATRLTIPAGRLTARVPVRALRDGLDEHRERLEVRLTGPRGVSLGTAVRTLLVTDKNPPPRVSAIGRSVSEPATGSTTVPVTLRLSAASGKTVRLSVVTVEGTAGPADFVALSRTLRIAPGTRTATVPVTVVADDQDEGDETFRLRITAVSNAVVATRDAVVTITPPSARRSH